jgi:hypothetical protein
VVLKAKYLIRNKPLLRLPIGYACLNSRNSKPLVIPEQKIPEHPVSLFKSSRPCQAELTN